MEEKPAIQDSPQGDEKPENIISHQTPQDDHPSPPVPKEDLTAWLQVIGAFCLNLNTWGLMNAFGVFQTFYQLDLLNSHSASNISWIGSTQAFLMFLTSVAAGPIFDAGHLNFLQWTGSILTVLGMFLTSICKVYYQCFLAQGVMMGLGFGLLYLPAPAIVSQFFHKRQALAIGMSSVGSALGGVMYPIVFTQLQPRIGFGWATRIIAFIILSTSAIPLLVMKSRTVASPWRTVLDRTAFRDIPYILLNTGLLFGFMGLWIIFYYIQLYALNRSSVSPNLASYLLVIINAASLPGRLLPGFYADRVGSINVQAVVAASSAILTFCLIAIRSTAGLIIYSLLYGFSAGAFMGLPAAGVARLSEDHSKIGIRLGMTLGFVGFGVLVSNPIAGAILAVDGSWTGLIVWCGALLTASTLSMAASRIAKVGYGLRKVI
ncbi:major facilitator superfamily transporter protein [Rutstroemia sp. NJR-2017a WRK4]|nr:major facilitator superfamily transporter protein [Rutstroemia sp. NJR-2017a WRK4]